MPGSKEIRTKIKSVQNTRKITKAMEMVAASKMRRAQERMRQARPYGEKIRNVAAHISHANPEYRHPFLIERNAVNRVGIIVVTADKGLCGGLNTNLLREVNHFDVDKTEFVPSGRKATAYLARTKRTMIADFELKDTPGLLDTKVISKFLIEKFLSREVDKVSVLYTSFVNTLIQKPTLRTLLPISEFDLPGQDEAAKDADSSSEYLFEPNASEVLSAILPHYLHFEVYQMVLDSRASEHSARMVAMKSATDNAKNMIKDLTLEYNKVRQASITNELLEISSAQMAIA